MIVDSMTRGDIHTFVRPIVMWHVPDDKHSRTYSYVAVHGTWKCGLPQWGPWLQTSPEIFFLGSLEDSIFYSISQIFI